MKTNHFETFSENIFIWIFNSMFDSGIRNKVMLWHLKTWIIIFFHLPKYFERRMNTKKLDVCFINMDMSVVPTSYIVSCHAWLKTCDIYAQTNAYTITRDFPSLDKQLHSSFHSIPYDYLYVHIWYRFLWMK